MNIFKFFYFITFFLFFANGESQYLDIANKHYQNRSLNSNENFADTTEIALAIENYLKSVNSNDLEANLGLLKSYYFKGKYCQLSEEESLELFKKGKDLGQKKINEYPNRADIRYWYLVNLGSWAEISGIVAAAREGLADQMKMHAEKIIKIDPLYADGGGYLMLGVVHFKTPYIPFFLSWPSNDEAIKWLRLSVDTGSATFSQNIYYAQSMLKDGKEEEAIDLLNKIIQESSSSNLSVEDWDQVKKAKNILNDL